MIVHFFTIIVNQIYPYFLVSSSSVANKFNLKNAKRKNQYFVDNYTVTLLLIDSDCKFKSCVRNIETTRDNDMVVVSVEECT